MHILLGSSIKLSQIIVNFKNQKLQDITGVSSNQRIQSVEQGDIATFLGYDPYYPFFATSNRYSFLNGDISKNSTTTLCLNIDPFIPSSTNTDINITFELNTSSSSTLQFSDLSVFLLDTSGIVRSPKSGMIPSESEQNVTYLNGDQICSKLQSLKQLYENKEIGAGLVHNFIPILLTEIYEKGDPHEFWEINTTHFSELGPDPRNPNDGTRNQGILPSCGSESCEGGQFKDHNLHSTIGYVYDDIFLANVMLDVSLEYLNAQKISCSL